METSFLEASLSVTSPGVLNPDIQKQIKTLTKELVKYFEGLYAKFPTAKVLKLLKKEVQLKEATGINFSDTLLTVISTWANSGNDVLIGILREPVTRALETGWIGTLENFIQEFGIDAGRLDDLATYIPTKLTNNVRTSLNVLAKDLAETTVANVSSIIGTGIATGQDASTIGSRIFDSFGDEDLTEHRSNLIARTELNRAISSGAYNAAQAVGAKKKRWNNVGDDRVSEIICIPNTGQGAINIDTAFGSGHNHTPGHPDCRCHVTYSGASKNKLKALLGVS
jgi:hypothetical protein